MKRIPETLFLLIAALATPAPGLDENSATATDMKFAFKVDPRLASGVYSGERWISPSTYVGTAAQDTVETRVLGMDAKGAPIRIKPNWVASEPEMVTVSPDTGDAVTITVKRTGESRLLVKAQELSRELAIRAASRNGFMQIEVTQIDLKQPAPEVAPLRDGGKEVQPAAEILSEADRLLAVKEWGEKNQRDGEAFLAANKAREGVVALESGLQYKVMKTGDGQKPTPDDVIVCRFRGTGINGTHVASSWPRNLPMVMPLNRTMKGWQEALQLMPIGSKWQVFIPPDLAYGERALPRVGPNATLIFEIELVAIQSGNSADAYPNTKPSSPPEIHRRKGRRGG